MKRFLTIFPTTAISVFMIAIPFVTSAIMIEFKNPLKSGDAMLLIKSVVGQLFPLVIMILTIVIIYCAARYVIGVGSGSEAEATKWKKALYWLIPGAILIAGSKTMIEAVRIFGEGIK